MRPKSPRILPLTPDQYTDEQKALIQGWDTLNFPKVMARHPALYTAYKTFAEQAVFRSSLTPRQREALILRTVVLCGDAYETAHHRVIARDMGMSDAVITAITTGGAGLTSEDQALVNAAEDLVRDHCIGEATWRSLAEMFSEIQLFDIVFLAGNYAMISMMTSSFGMEVEDDPDNNWRIEREATVADLSEAKSAR